MAQSNNRPKGEHLQIAMFALGSLDQPGEVRNDGFLEFLRFCGEVIFRLGIFSMMSVLRLSQNFTSNNFDESGFATKSKLDLEYFRRLRRAKRRRKFKVLRVRERRKEESKFLTVSE